MSSKKLKGISRTGHLKNHPGAKPNGWFEFRRLWWIPVSQKGWIATAVYIAYVAWAFIRLRREYTSLLYFLNWFLQEWLSVTILYAILAIATGKKSQRN